MRKGGGGKCPPIVFLEGANIHHYAFVEGAVILPCQLLGGQMSTHAIFHRGADVRGGGGGGKCPAPRCVVSLSKTLNLLSIVLLNSNMTEKMMLVT